jgi:hypothetical protein
LHFFWCNPPEIEDGKPHWRREERCLKSYGNKQQEPDQFGIVYYPETVNRDTQAADNRCEERQNNQSYLDPVKEKA